MRTEEEVQEDIDEVEDELIDARWAVEEFDDQISKMERRLIELECELEVRRGTT